jgi:hypothetical protein
MKKVVQSSNMKRRQAFQTLDKAATSVIQSGNTEPAPPQTAHTKSRRSKAMSVLLTATIVAAH